MRLFGLPQPSETPRGLTHRATSSCRLDVASWLGRAHAGRVGGGDGGGDSHLHLRRSLDRGGLFQRSRAPPHRPAGSRPLAAAIGDGLERVGGARSTSSRIDGRRAEGWEAQRLRSCRTCRHCDVAGSPNGAVPFLARPVRDLLEQLGRPPAHRVVDGHGDILTPQALLGYGLVKHKVSAPSTRTRNSNIRSMPASIIVWACFPIGQTLAHQAQREAGPGDRRREIVLRRSPCTDHGGNGDA